LAERDALLSKALASCDEATSAFEDEPCGPGQWTCHACFAWTNASWERGSIVHGGPKEIAHEPDCWAEQARIVLSASAEPAKCKTCNGSKLVDDRELTHSVGGIPYENGPIKCVKDCPDCAEPAGEALQRRPETNHDYFKCTKGE
jgi:hypothetical protein